MKRLLLSLSLLTSGCMAAADADRLAAVESATGDATAGQTLFATQCATCHGASGQGGSGPRIAGADETEVISAMLEGPDEMPVFTSLTDEDLASLAAFVVSM